VIFLEFMFSDTKQIAVKLVKLWMSNHFSNCKNRSCRCLSSSARHASMPALNEARRSRTWWRYYVTNIGPFHTIGVELQNQHKPPKPTFRDLFSPEIHSSTNVCWCLEDEDDVLSFIQSASRDLKHQIIWLSILLCR